MEPSLDVVAWFVLGQCRDSVGQCEVFGLTLWRASLASLCALRWRFVYAGNSLILSLVIVCSYIVRTVSDGVQYVGLHYSVLVRRRCALYDGAVYVPVARSLYSVM